MTDLLSPMAVLAVAVLSIAPAVCAQDPARPGYDDSPRLPDSPWRVHDRARPWPPVVEPPTPGTAGEPGRAPSDAVVLFDGSDLSAWRGEDGEARWDVRDGAMVVNGTGDLRTVEEFGDCQLHLEWMAPLPVEGASQGRGNSGVFLMDRYEVQILDSHDNPTYADGQAAALYGQRPPDVNASRPPGEWQTYDIYFHAPRFHGEELVEPARITVLHNGIVVHHDQPLLGATTHRRVARYAAHPARAPLRLQDHGDPVRFRSVWIRPLGSGAAK